MIIWENNMHKMTLQINLPKNASSVPLFYCKSIFPEELSGMLVLEDIPLTKTELFIVRAEYLTCQDKILLMNSNME